MITKLSIAKPFGNAPKNLKFVLNVEKRRYLNGTVWTMEGMLS